jgi:hypothetical protein
VAENHPALWESVFIFVKKISKERVLQTKGKPIAPSGDCQVCWLVFRASSITLVSEQVNGEQ